MAQYDFINESGVIVPDASETLTEVREEYKGVFGEDLDLDDATPEGILITAETTSRNGIATNNAQLANQINPNINGGIFLDAVWALTGGKRAKAAPSTFNVDPDLTGVAGTLIPTGSIATNSNGDEFKSLADLTLDGAGLGSVAFVSVENGAIACGIADLTNITSNVLGWETITNSVSATLGTATQSDVSARSERKGTLGLQGSALAVAVFSRVRAVAGVNSLAFRENETAAPIVIDGINLVANSIWACVDGGLNSEVANALLGAKSGGCAWNNGNSSTPISEIVVDPVSGQSYTVLFDRPDEIPVLYQVTIKATTISNSTQIIIDAILAYAQGEIDGEEGLVTGADVSPWEAAGAINIVEPGITVTKIEVTKAAVINFSTDTIAIDLFEKATVQASSIVVIIG